MGPSSLCGISLRRHREDSRKKVACVNAYSLDVESLVLLSLMWENACMDTQKHHMDLRLTEVFLIPNFKSFKISLI